MVKGFRMRKRNINGCGTTNAYEKRQLLAYLYEFMCKKSNLKEYLPKIIEWHEETGYNYLNFGWFVADDKNDYDSFERVFRRYLKEYMHSAEMFRQKLENTLLRKAQCKISTIEQKLEIVAKLFNLSELEKNVFGFYVRTKLNPALENMIYTIFGSHSGKNTMPALFLPYSQPEIGNCLNFNSKLVTCGLLDNDYDGDIIVSNRGIKIFGQQFTTVQELRELILEKPLKTNLIWKDFKHIEEKDYCAKLLKGALNNRAKGINILLYGEPGTGKTEFAKALTQKVRANLYAVAEKGDEHRLESLCMMQNVVSNDKKTCLLIDEADDLTDERKIRVNRLLENNTVPCVWIVNSIRFWDKAFLRRFSYAINFKKPDLATRTEIWQKTFKQYGMTINRKQAQKLAEEYNLTPSFAENAVKSVKLINGTVDDVKKSLSAMEKAYNNGREKAVPVTKKTEKKQLNFNPALLNTDTDLSKFTEQVKNLTSRRFSLCLYGVSGTGKSAFAEYLAEQLNLPVIKKRCSDILSMWHGETEQNIAAAFREAKEKKALLIFDEADSFLQDRRYSSHSWEVTQVNEMLTQMEKHEFPFVCTTNLMDNLDKAALRRFTFKVEYKYMTPEQNTLAIEHFFGFKDVDLSHISSLTPGDFVVVKQKAEIMGYMENKEEIIKMLELEQKQKAPVSHRIGFC